MFLRKPAIRRDPLPVTMSGVRMGERVLQVGVDDPRIAGAIAAKVGLSGHAAMVVADEQAAARARDGIADVGGLVDLQVTPSDTLPFEAATFDALVAHNMDLALAALPAERRAARLAEWRRVLRDGGRLIVIEAGTRTGLGAVLRPGPKPDTAYEARGGTVGALHAAGFRPVRMLGDREGFRFIEGLKT
jgi:ubiquinone/menaquinone biosynthesis C-methylase UbiE